MEYRDRAKGRKIKRFLLSCISMVKFKGISLSRGEKIVIIGGFIVFCSLFFSWVGFIDGSKPGNAFSNLTGSVGFTLLILLGIVSFAILSYKKKEKIKLSAGIHFRDTNIITGSGIMILILSLNTFNFVNGLHRFSKMVIYGSGIILSMTGAIIIIIGGLFIRREKKNEKYHIYTNELGNEEAGEVIDKNMKLPF